MAYDTNGKKSTSPVTAAIFGAAVATVATLLLDSRNRQKLRNNINKFLDEGQTRLDELNLTVEEIKEKGRKKVAEKLRETEAKLEAGPRKSGAA